MKQPFCLIFDMDGVIAYTGDFHEKAWFAFCENHNLPIDSKLFRNVLFGMSNRETLKILYSRELPIEEFEKYVDEKEKLFRALAAKALKPLNGLKNFLEEAKTAGFTMAVASSAPLENIIFVLEKTETGLYFDQITSADEILNSKPHPEIFLKTAAKTGYQPADCFVFEDSFAGIQAGNSAGMKVIGVASTHKIAELSNTIFNIHNFDEINIQKLHHLFEASS
jgi:HAD superfamily hydrolase (TIGR01509 family)